MKILYLVYFDVNSEKQTGVNKKVKNQVNALRKIGHEVELAGCNNEKMYFDNGNIVRSYSIKYGFTHYRWSVKRILEKEKIHYDIIYIRFPGTIEPVFYSTMKMLSDTGANVILELPTYPIGYELKGLLEKELKNEKIGSFLVHFMAVSIHTVLSRRMKNIVKRIVTYMPYSKIWNLKTVQIDNGVDIDSCPIINKKNISSDYIHKKPINCITVANVSIWHGIDRMILGVKEYYNTKDDTDEDIILTVVGDSPLCKELKTLAKQQGVDNRIVFVGAKYGNDLNKEYEKADIAIGSLGMHRTNVINGSTLKIKEYCSLGIPFVYAYNEKMIDESFKYALKLPADDTPINIKKVISFFKELNMNSEKSMEMHQFAVNHYTWEEQMKTVLNSLEG